MLGTAAKPGLVPRAVDALATAREHLQIAVLELSKDGMSDLQPNAEAEAGAITGTGVLPEAPKTPSAARGGSRSTGKGKAGISARKSKGKRGALTGLIRPASSSFSSSSRSRHGHAAAAPLTIRDDGTGRSVQVGGLNWKCASGKLDAMQLL